MRLPLLRSGASDKSVRFGPFLDDTDGKTIEDGLTILQADIRLSKNGGDFAQKNDAGAATHDEAGWYYTNFDTIDLNTPGELLMALHESGALPVWHRFDVVGNVNEWHVAKTGVDTNGGHNDWDAFLTIQAAVDASDDGDIIIIHEGDYAETVTLTGKAVALKGTHRYKCKIVPATGDGIVLEDYCSLKKLSVEAVGAANNIAINGYVSSVGQTHITIEDVSAYGSLDGLGMYETKYCFIRNSYFKGKYDGVNIGNCVGNIFESCILETVGTYGTTVNSNAIRNGGDAVFSNCIIIAARTDTSSYALGGFDGDGDNVCFNNCSFDTVAGANHTGIAYGIRANNSSMKVAVHNCVFNTVSANGTPHDLLNTAGSIVVSGSNYSTSSGTITQMNNGWAAAVNAEADSALTDYDPATKTEMDTAHDLLATEAKQDIIDTNVDTVAVDVAGLDGDAMRGTNSAALASVVGALADAAAAGEVTEADTLMQYIKQLLNVLIGAAGIGSFPAEAAPANAVSLAEVIRAIHADVTGLNGSAMAGTDGANTTVPDAAGIAAGLHATTDGKVDTVDDFLDTEIAAIKTVTDNLAAAAATMVTGTVVADGGNSTTQFKTGLTEATDDHYNGRIVVFTSGVLINQATDITDYDGTNKIITVTAMTETPSADDTFVII